jgi:hypothetical protein
VRLVTHVTHVRRTPRGPEAVQEMLTGTGTGTLTGAERETVAMIEGIPGIVIRVEASPDTVTGMAAETEIMAETRMKTVGGSAKQLATGAGTGIATTATGRAAEAMLHINISHYCVSYREPYRSCMCVCECLSLI